MIEQAEQPPLITPVTTKDVIAGLEKRYRWPEWAFLTEVRVGTGYNNDNQQRIDAWAINCFAGKNLVRVAIEIKVSRGDFLRELKTPAKRRRALLMSNRFYFAAPEGLIKADEVPTECGLLELQGNGVMEKVVEAPWRDSMAPTWTFVASIARRLNEAQGRNVWHPPTLKGVEL